MDIGAARCARPANDLLLFIPGVLADSKIWIRGFGQVRVLDGGGDGDASTDDGPAPFLRQGLFVA